MKKHYAIMITVAIISVVILIYTYKLTYNYVVKKRMERVDIQIFNPTGKGVRNDDMGAGHFGAKRTTHVHNGLDLIVTPGQNIIAPITGIIKKSKPDSTSQYQGCKIMGTGIYSGIEFKMFYMLPNIPFGREVTALQTIGTAQDISKKYGSSMIPHLHAEIKLGGLNVDPQQYISL